VGFEELLDEDVFPESDFPADEDDLEDEEEDDDE
jgi:hypothetical protein